ncbi:hypothetical protein GCM10025882_33300 [Acinetobacter gyllenbergii]|uniref:Uncharacterized protein n=1 Tax=Acinetobacter gyllenbergii CIP 110306 = MTCC 11365 TaxID=1217657 RepID=A0A829HGI2_9GAMM|nr:hypothetical protein [Acinetobacter gyllenbergii]EPF80461.1 hypothetical protein F957_02121 [Acinetobacter gyllenbergii CIP 110306 = MTCC 11365]EPH34232.1 hypothetical protein L293_3596 [Acinetobacter gyllenbergii CIP 110306 = MTCC 11365]GMA12905.1 hypothetical protein GCM10025882_33300 [Acinetobacter gyllenbergii]
MFKLILLILFIVCQVSYAGYDLHITKKEFYFNEGECITPAEWHAYMMLDPSVKSDLQNSAQDFLILIDKQEIPLIYSHDSCSLSIKNPSPEVIRKMIEIANKLHATVQGDDAEIYITPEEIIRR